MKNQKGFTLAELLIVMAIIVVLAAVAIPTFGKQLETSRETSDMELVRNIYTDVLSVAIKDGADGKLDGQIGTMTISTTGITPAEVTTSTANPATEKYTVALTTWMSNARFAQNGSQVVGTEAQAGSWKYVGKKLMGLTVPPVNVKTANLAFSFQIDANGDVKPLATEVGSGDDKITDGLFLPS